MELRSTREMRRNEQLAKTTARKAEVPDASAKTQSAPSRPLSDKVSLSQQAIDFIDQQRERLLRELEEHRARQQSKLAEAKNKGSELDTLGEQLKVLELCQKIAASIMKGDRVPNKDLIYLMKNDPDGYRIAMALRRHNDDPEEVDSVLEDEENQNSCAESGGGETASVQPAAPASGGGEASAPPE